MNDTLGSASRKELEAMVTMLQEELAATNREVLLLTLDLEHRVEERTAALSESNKALSLEIAERKKAEKRERDLRKDLAKRATLLEAANSELEAFSYSVSHDLRAPLRHIGAFATILAEECADALGPEGQDHLQRILRTVGKMDQLINDLLTFSRMGRTELRAVEVNFENLVADVIKELAPDTAGRKVEWTIASLPSLLADRALLYQVFVNLLGNALKFSRDRTITKISVEATLSENGEFVFAIRDNGVGFDMRHVDKLFGVFERLHSANEFPGSGIGLAIVRRIIARHEGRVWAESVLDAGSSFYFTLPDRRSILM